MAKKTSKKSKNKPVQTKIPGTERINAIPEIEEAAEAYREARDQRMALGEEEAEALETLTDLLKKHDLSEYLYEGEDGVRYRAFISSEVKAKVRKLKAEKAEKSDTVE